MPDVYVSPTKKVKKPSKKKPRKQKQKAEVKIVSEEIKQRRTRHPFSAFMILPKGLTFETQAAEEEILFVLRRHLITNVPWLLITLLMLLAPLSLRYIPLIDFLPARYQLISIIIWYLITIAFILESFLSWYFNVNIITDERIIDIDFYSLIYKEVSETKIENIQDVTYKMGGVVRALFNFGTVYVQTAGEKPEFEFEDVPNPSQVTKIINRLILQEEQEKIEGRVR